MVIPRTVDFARAQLQLTRVILVASLAFSACSDDSGAADASVDHGLVDTAIVDSSGADLAAPETSPDLPLLGPDLARPAPDLGPPLDAGPSGDGPAITCTATVGSGSVSGSVNGQVLSATTAGGVLGTALGIDAYGVALMDQSGTCAGISTTMPAPKVWILVCDKTPGTYAVGATCKGDAGSGVFVKNQVSVPSAGSDPKATAGTITIDSFDPTCGGKVKGSFSVTFGTDAVSGSFDTVGCGTIKLM